MRSAAHALARAPGFTASVVVILALALGANAALFSVANAVLWNRLPYADAGRLVILSEVAPGLQAGALVSPANYLDWTRALRTLSGLAAYRPWGFVVTGSDDAERVRGARVSASLFPLLGVRPIAGRMFLPSEDLFGGPRVVVISERIWRQRFEGEGDPTGRAIVLNGVAHTIVGVLPRQFDLPDADLWVPLALEPFTLSQRGNRALTVVGRLADGVSQAQAQAEMDGVARDLAARFPDSNAGWTARAVTLREHVSGHVRPTLLVCWAAAVLVLLAACANSAGLLLARAGARQQEMAIRRALGATGARLFRGLLAENLMVAVIAGAGGIPIAFGLLAVLVKLAPPDIPRLAAAAVDLRGVAFMLALSIVTGMLSGVLPALRGSRDIPPLLRGARASGAGRAVFRQAAVAGQLALAIVTLLCAGLLLRSFERVQAVDTGFDPSHVLTLTLSPDAAYREPARRAIFFDDVLRRIRAIAGVSAAGTVSHIPLAAAPLTVDLAAEPSGATSTAPLLVNYSAVGGDWFAAMAIPLRRGRLFTAADSRDAPPAVIVSDNLARLLWGTENAIGRRVVIGGTVGANRTPRQIVGTVGNVRAALESDPPLQVYVPYATNAWPTMSLAVRTSGDPGQWSASVRAAIAEVDPAQAAYDIRPFDRIASRAVATRRFQALIVAFFAVAALTLAIAGVYSLVSYNVRLRTHEIGIRLALGATRHHILSLVIRESVQSSGAGIVAGLAVSLAAGRLLQGILYDVSPADPVTVLFVTLGITPIVCVASAIAARRATRVDPVVSLRGG